MTGPVRWIGVDVGPNPPGGSFAGVGLPMLSVNEYNIESVAERLIIFKTIYFV